MRKIAMLAAGAAFVLSAQPLLAGTIVGGFNTSSFPANDDGYVSNVDLGFEVNFFGVTRNETFVGNNGFITFDYGESAYTPSGLGAGYSGMPIIAPFFADVDTRGGASGLTTYGTGSFDGRDAFGVTWVDVGYYYISTDKVNSFQLLLVDRSDIGSGDFDIYFNYDKIEWETGDASGGRNGLGGVSASAGFNAGTGEAGSFYELPGSLVNGAFLDGGPNSLVAGSNMGMAGRYVFEVRNGDVYVPPVDPNPGTPAVPEPASWAMMILGFGLVGTAVRRRRASGALAG